MTDQPSPPLLDGLTGPAAQPTQQNPQQKSTPPDSKKTHGIAAFLFYAFVALYVTGAIALMAILPSPDPVMENLASLATMIYGMGIVFWLGLGIFALLRIVSVKTSGRIQRIALVRILIVEVPVLAISALMLFAINREPAIGIDILSPTSADQFVAPVSVTFGTETANTIFAAKRLSVIRYQWDFESDGNINVDTAEPQVTAYYPREGVYQVRAIAHLSDGTTKVLTRVISIPRSQFAVEPREPVIDEPTTFSVSHMFSKETEKNFVRARWDFDGDGTIDIDTDKLSTTYTYHTLGPVTATVEISNQTNATTTFRRTLTVVEPPKQPFPVSMNTTPSTLLSPAPFGVVFTIDTDEPLGAVTWDFGDNKGDENKTGRTALHTFDDVGNFIVTATVRSASGATARLTKLVRVTEPLQLPDLSFTGTPEVRSSSITGEVPLTLEITPRTSEPLITFSWDAPGADEVISTEKTLNVVYRRTGEYTVELIGIDTDQKVLRKKLTVVVNPPKPIVSVEIDPTSPIAPETVRFDASNTFIAERTITGFEWDFGDGTSTRAGAQVTHVYDKSGRYTVRVQAITLEGNTYSTDVTLIVREPLKDVCFLPSRTTGTSPLGVRFDTSCSTSGFVSWHWNFGDGSESREQDPTHVFVAPGEYVVTLTATDDQGNQMQDKTTISVSPGT